MNHSSQMRINGFLYKIMDEKLENIICNAIKTKKQSNCYLNYELLLKKIEKKEMDVISMDDVVLLVEHREQYYELYYFLLEETVSSTCWKKLGDQLAKYDVLAMHVVSNKDVRSNIVAQYLNLHYYKTYVRKRFINDAKKKEREMMDVLFAEKHDLLKIQRLLNDSFDVLADNIPNQEEIEDLINKRQILKIEIKNNIQGVFLYEDTGVKSYARALCVAEEYQNSVLGYSLFAKYYNNHIQKTKVFMLWVDKDNVNVLKLHNKFGYKEDGAVDNIFIRRKKDVDNEE